MMRRLSYLLLMAFALLACNRKMEDEETGPYVEITLTTGDPSNIVTKSEEDGSAYQEEGIEKTFHENRIQKVDLFFYPSDNTDEPATYHKRIDYTGNEKVKSDLLRLSFTSDEIAQLIFPGDADKCTVFAVVNWPGSDPMVEEDDLSQTSLPTLKQRSLTTNFVSPAKVRQEPTTNHAQTSFLMSGQTTLALRGRNQVLSAAGTIALERYACKMTVGVKVAPQALQGNDVWEPMLENMEIYLVDGIKYVSLDGTYDPSKITSEDYFTYRFDPSVFARQKEGTNEYEFVYPITEDGYYNTYPFYMYPQSWKYGSTQAPNTEPYLKLMLPWKRTIGGYTQKNFYYKVLLPNDYRDEYVCQFVRNNWYHIDIDVSILGTETDDDKVPITAGGIQIFYWQDKNVVVKNAEIGNARYLSVDQDTTYVYDIEEATMSYVSSHPVMVQNFIAVRPYDGTVTPTQQDPNPVVMGGTVRVASDNTIFPVGTKYLEYNEAQRKAIYKRFHPGEERDWYEDTGSAIVIHHDLANDYTNKEFFDYSPYTIRYTLVHRDNPDDQHFRRVQTVIQYPGIFITYTPNEAPKKAQPPYGYVYVDNYQLTKSEFDSGLAASSDKDAYKLENIWRVVHYSSGGTDMYKITTTVLPSGSDFIIGDPRENVIDNLRNGNSDDSDDFRNAPCVSVNPQTGKMELEKQGDNNKLRSLTCYYPTDPSDRTVNMIAPSYQISTKFSGSEYDGVPIEQARYRCAAFQENGFPAGRWRLPTKGEIKFAAQLSANGVFEWQFGGNYWSANGAVHVDKSSGEVRDAVSSELTDGKRALVRCVYDTWYWGDERVLVNSSGAIDPDGKPTLFVWADAAR